MGERRVYISLRRHPQRSPARIENVLRYLAPRHHVEERCRERFLFDWKLQYQVDPLLIECKNKETLTYDDLRQTAAYLGKRMGDWQSWLAARAPAATYGKC